MGKFVVLQSILKPQAKQQQGRPQCPLCLSLLLLLVLIGSSLCQVLVKSCCLDSRMFGSLPTQGSHIFWSVTHALLDSAHWVDNVIVQDLRNPPRRHRLFKRGCIREPPLGLT